MKFPTSFSIIFLVASALVAAENLQEPKSVPKPPGENWPVQIRPVNGPRNTSGPDQPYVTFALPDKTPPPAAHPPDKPVSNAGQESFDKLNKALAPYIAKGRA